MSLLVTLNGATYIIPQTNEVGWGSNLDDYFVAIAAGVLQKTGGSFTLSAETDFGSSFGLKSLYYKSRSANIAATGILRLANNSDAVSWRNAGNSADLALTVNASNQLCFNGTPIESNALTSAHILVGNASNVATDVAMSGDIAIDNTGATTIQPGVVTSAKIAATTIVNSNISASAAIAYSKLALSNSILNADINSAAAIAVTKLANGTANQVLGSNAAGNSNEFKTLTATANQVSVTHGVGTVTFGTPQDIATGSAVQFGSLALGAALDASSILSLTSTSKGFLPPRMTTTQRNAISSPTDGLVVFDTSLAQLFLRTGGVWTPLSVGGGSGTVASGTQYQMAYYAANGTTVSGLGNLVTDVSGNINVTGQTSPNLYVSSTSVSGVQGRFLASGTTAMYIQTQSNHPLYFTTNNGVNALTIETNKDVTVPNGHLLLSNGATGAGNLAWSFISDTDTGMYRGGANDIIIQVGGVDQLELSTTKAIFNGVILAPDGTLANPSHSFGSEQGTGLRRRTSNTLTSTVGGTDQTECTLGGFESFNNALFDKWISASGGSSIAGAVSKAIVNITDSQEVGTALNIAHSQLIISPTTGGDAGWLFLAKEDAHGGQWGNQAGVKLFTGSNTQASTTYTSKDTTARFFVMSPDPFGADNMPIPGTQFTISGTTYTIRAYRPANSRLFVYEDNTAAASSGTLSNIKYASTGLNLDSTQKLTYNDLGNGINWVRATYDTYAWQQSASGFQLKNVTDSRTEIQCDQAGGVAIHGVVDNSTAAAGFVGEVIQSSVTSVSIPTTANQNDITSISLTAGTWLVTAQCYLTNGTGTTNVTAGISTTSGNSTTGLTQGNNWMIGGVNAGPGVGGATVANYLVTLSSTTTHYLKGAASFTSPTPFISGRLTAVRIR